MRIPVLALMLGLGLACAAETQPLQQDRQRRLQESQFDLILRQSQQTRQQAPQSGADKLRLRQKQQEQRFQQQRLFGQQGRSAKGHGTPPEAFSEDTLFDTLTLPDAQRLDRGRRAQDLDFKIQDALSR